MTLARVKIGGRPKDLDSAVLKLSDQPLVSLRLNLPYLRFLRTSGASKSSFLILFLVIEANSSRPKVVRLLQHIEKCIPLTT